MITTRSDIAYAIPRKKRASPLVEIDPDKAREAADRLWQTIVQQVNSAPDQPASGRRNSRTKDRA